MRFHHISFLSFVLLLMLTTGLIVKNNPLTFAAAGVLGLAVNYLSNSIIKQSNATTVKLLAAVRGPLVVLSGVLMFAEQVMPFMI
jgi:hypothetical protein